MDGTRIRGALAGTAGLLLGITGIIRYIAGDGAGMASAMLRFAPAASTGLPEEQYAGMAEMITGYLTGRRDFFGAFLKAADGSRVSCFHDYEAAHMEDCRRLITLDTVLCGICLAVLLGMLLWTALEARKRGSGRWLPFLRGARGAVLVLCGLGAALALWAAIDFDSLFVLFHRIAFTNDLWLLDPRTDLLIRLMPAELFVHLGVRGLIIAAAWITALLAAAGAGVMMLRRKAANDGNTEAT